MGFLEDDLILYIITQINILKMSGTHISFILILYCKIKKKNISTSEIYDEIMVVKFGL